ncbi:MAG: HEAT repeat domain-containing protein [Planctomycetota bacterium]
MKLLFALILLLPLSTATAQPPLGPEGKTVQQWADQLNSAEFRQQWHAAYVLGTLGPKAAMAVPALHAVLVEVNSRNEYNNEYVRSMAVWALGRIGSAAESEIPFLIETMRSTKLLSMSRRTAEALGNFGPAAKPAVTELLKMLSKDDEITRVNAAVALWKIESHPKALPALLEMLRHGNASQAYRAAVALGQMEKEADTVAPALIEALHTPDADVRRAAARSLGQLGKAAFPSLKKANALQNPDAEARRMVIEALSWIGRDAVPALTAALQNTSPAVRRAAARALGNLGADAQSARSALETAASDPQEDVRTAAAKALQRIRGE